MLSRLLISEPPLQVLPSLATMLGLNEAIFLQQLHYWLEKSPHVHDGKKWVYNSNAQWVEQLPFWSDRTLRRIVAKLADMKIVIVAQLHKDKRDRTNWYTIDYDVLMTMCRKHQDKVSSSNNRTDCPHVEQDKLSSCLMYTETTSETTSERHAKTRARKTPDLPETEQRKTPPSLELTEALNILLPKDEQGGLAMGQDHGCALYHPGLPCEHEQEVLSAVRGVLWPSRIALPKSHPSVQAFAHRYDGMSARVAAAHALAVWWKQSRRVKDWTIPLMFADAETELANAQATQAPGGETGLERYIRTLQENDRATTWVANAQATQAPGGETGLENYIRTLQENDRATT